MTKPIHSIVLAPLVKACRAGVVRPLKSRAALPPLPRSHDPMSLLSINVLSKRFDDAVVLCDVRLTLRHREAVAVVGASGSGKSTLLRIAARLDKKFAGWVRVGKNERSASGDIGVLFQEPRLFPWLTTAQNVAYAAGASGAPQADERALKLLNEVGLADRAEALPRQLSAEQAQRAALARALYTKPKVLLLDEPFAALDTGARAKLQELLSALSRRHGFTLLFATHDVEEAVLLADRVVVLGGESRGITSDLFIDLPHPRERRDPNLTLLRAQVLDALDAAHVVKAPPRAVRPSAWDVGRQAGTDLFR
jgi:sulfonate transport system ATP-binding protein